MILHLYAAYSVQNVGWGGGRSTAFRGCEFGERILRVNRISEVGIYKYHSVNKYELSDRAVRYIQFQRN